MPKHRWFITPPSRFSKGKVHDVIYDEVNHVWHPFCAVGRRMVKSYHGFITTNEADTDNKDLCKICFPPIYNHQQ